MECGILPQRPTRGQGGAAFPSRREVPGNAIRYLDNLSHFYEEK